MALASAGAGLLVLALANSSGAVRACEADISAFAQTLRASVLEHDDHRLRLLGAPDHVFSGDQLNTLERCGLRGGAGCDNHASNGSPTVQSILARHDIEARLVCDAESDTAECWLTFARRGVPDAVLLEPDAYFRDFVTTRVVRADACWRLAPDYSPFGVGAGNPLLEDYG